MRSRFVQFLDRQSKPLLLLVCLFVVAIVGIADYLTGYEVAFSIFYVAPVAVAAYIVGRRSGLIVALLSAAIWLAADLGAGHVYEPSWVAYWNMFTRFLFFAFVAATLAAFRELLSREEELSRTDFLTGLANSRAFYEMANAELNRARRYGHAFSIAHIDVDNFKAINDSFGHHVGDDLLRVIAENMRSNIRKTDVAARLGGDEFILLLPETAKDEAAVALTKLHKHLNEVVESHRWPVSFSVGLLTCLDAPRSVDDLLRMADKLTYEAKSSGKNTIRQDVIAARLVSVVPEQA